MKKIALTHDADKFLRELQSKQYKQVGSAIFGLLSNSQPHDSSALKGAENGERRVDVGEYRVIYREDGDTIEVMVIGKRNDDNVYKIWNRIK